MINDFFEKLTSSSTFGAMIAKDVKFVVAKVLQKTSDSKFC